MSAITSSLNGTAMPMIERDFIDTPLDKAVDVETLDNSLYTDFSGTRHNAWTFNYDSLTEAQYNALKDAYDDQFVSYQYPLLSIPYFSVSGQPCRMSINPKSIIDNCGSVEGVEITFRATAQLPEVS